MWKNQAYSQLLSVVPYMKKPALMKAQKESFL